MSQDAISKCPDCGTKVDVELVNRHGLADSLVKATAAEAIIEVCCKEDGCNRVWRAVYGFAGNQE